MKFVKSLREKLTLKEQLLIVFFVLFAYLLGLGLGVFGYVVSITCECKQVIPII